MNLPGEDKAGDGNGRFDYLTQLDLKQLRGLKGPLSAKVAEPTRCPDRYLVW